MASLENIFSNYSKVIPVNQKNNGNPRKNQVLKLKKQRMPK